MDITRRNLMLGAAGALAFASDSPQEDTVAIPAGLSPSLDRLTSWWREAGDGGRLVLGPRVWAADFGRDLLLVGGGEVAGIGDLLLMEDRYYARLGGDPRFYLVRILEFEPLVPAGTMKDGLAWGWDEPPSVKAVCYFPWRDGDSDHGLRWYREENFNLRETRLVLRAPPHMIPRVDELQRQALLAKDRYALTEDDIREEMACTPLSVL